MSGYGDAQRIESELDVLFAEAASCSDEIQASLARYACVLASAYLEASFREIIQTCARSQASPAISRYVESTLNMFRDPNTEKILKLLGRLGQEYRDEVEAKVVGKIKSSVDSIMANRNSIAHGRSSSISLGRVQTYYNDARLIVSISRTAVSS